MTFTTSFLTMSPWMQLSGQSALADPDISRALQVRAEAAGGARDGIGSIRTARRPAPALLVAGGTQQTRTAVAAAYLQTLINKDIVDATKAHLISAGDLNTQRDLAENDDPSESLQPWVREARRWQGVVQGIEGLAVLEVNEPCPDLRRLVDEGISVLVVTTALGAWLANETVDGAYFVSDYVEKAMAKRRLELGLTPNLPGFGLDPYSDRRELARMYGYSGDDRPPVPSFFDVIETTYGTVGRLREATLGSVVIAPDRLDLDGGSLHFQPPTTSMLHKASACDARIWGREDDDLELLFERVLEIEPRLQELALRCRRAGTAREYNAGVQNHEDPVLRAGTSRLVKLLVGPQRGAVLLTSSLDDLARQLDGRTLGHGGEPERIERIAVHEIPSELHWSAQQVEARPPSHEPWILSEDAFAEASLYLRAMEPVEDE